ncbi:MAG: ribonuclease E/G, partial [Alphaproteobacteria bacterium]|nr:ribonuclease E/G [Alphaproteobacteria bacterium]
DKTTNSVAPILIHEEGNIIKRTIRDLYQRTMDKIIVQGKDAYKEARAFMKTYTPAHVKKIELYDDTEAPLFHKFNIEDKIDNILEPTVSLPSGGTIVINTTEALTAIDVNSGKSKHERDIEVTAFKTNLEAAREIGRQIKLRDIGGIIVIDFIDMVERRNQERIEKAMRDAMKKDYSNIQFGKLSQFGLMEISRQRLRTSLADATFIQCSHCAGSGKTLANETIALSVIRKIENFLVKRIAKSVIVDVAPGVDLFILNRKRNLIIDMEKNYDVSIEVVRNKMMSATDCKILVKEYIPSEQRSDKPIKEENVTTKDNENRVKKKVRKIKKVTASKNSSEPSSEEQSGVKRKKLVRVKRRSISDKNEISKTATTPELTEDMPADKSTDNLPANKNKKKGWLRKIFE